MTRKIIIFFLFDFLMLNTVFAEPLDFSSKNDLKILELVREVSLNKSFVGLVVAHNIGGKKVLARVSQGKVGRVIQKKREILDSEIEYIHNGYEIREYFSNKKVVKIYNNSAPVFPNFLLKNPNEVLNYYTLHRLGFSSKKIANKNTSVFELKSKDKFRWGVRFWLDSQTGLLLKLQYLDENENVLKKEFFAEISIEPSTKLDLHFSSPDSKKWRKIYISTFTDQNDGLVYNKNLKNGFTFMNCLDSKVYDSKQNLDLSFVHHQCLYSDGVAIVSAVTQDQIRPIKIFQRSNGCMSEKVGLKGNKPMYIGGCVPRKTIQYFFNKLSVE
jgi:sigma-E factor negative regulatory protein RseB